MLRSSLSACSFNGMDRRLTTRRRRGAFWLLLLTLVSVVAPVLADSYVCPMAKMAAEQVSSCCAKTIEPPDTSTPDSPRFEPACDCPKLSWTVDANDMVRDLRIGSENASASTEVPRLVLTNPVVLRISVRAIDRYPSRSSPALWLQNQSILC